MILIYLANKQIHQTFNGFGLVTTGETGTLLIDGQDTTTCAADVEWKYIADQVLEKNVEIVEIPRQRAIIHTTYVTQTETIDQPPLIVDGVEIPQDPIVVETQVPVIETTYEDYVEYQENITGYKYDADHYESVDAPIPSTERIAALEQYVMDKELGLI